MPSYFLLLFIFTPSNFVFPNSTSELYINNNYNIKWNTSNNYSHIHLVHKDPFGMDLISKNEELIILNDKIIKDNYDWTIPYNLNKYNIQAYNFRFILTDSKELYHNSLDRNNIQPFFSEYFSIKSNIKVDKVPKDIYLNTDYIINFTGFKFGPTIILEEYKNNEWYSDKILANKIKTSYIILNIHNNYFTNNKCRIQYRENDIIRLSNIFNIKLMSSTTSTTLTNTNDYINRDTKIYIDKVDKIYNNTNNNKKLKMTYIYIMAPLLVICLIFWILFFCNGCLNIKCFNNTISNELDLENSINPIYKKRQTRFSIYTSNYENP
jgi:hypothetical protein